MSPFAAAMSECALPAMIDAQGEPLIHYSPGQEPASIDGLFEEYQGAGSNQRDGRAGETSTRTATLTLATDITVALGTNPSQFKKNTEFWKAVGISNGPGVQLVHLELFKQVTQKSPTAKSHP